MHGYVNVLGALTVALCAILLLRAYRKVGARLLLWSGLCFAALAVSNGLVFLDLVVMPDRSLYTWRLAIAALGSAMMVYGLIFETDP